MLKSVVLSDIRGKISAPPSKSIAQRAVIAALLAKGRTTLLNFGKSADCLTALQMAKSLGAELHRYTQKVRIDGGLDYKTYVLNCGESGLAVRAFAPVAALLDHPVRLIGKGSLLKRPVDMIEEALLQLKASCISNDGVLPLTLCGPLRGGRAQIDGSISSQLLTGLLMALPLCEEDSELTVCGLQSRPYIDLTIDLLHSFGITVTHLQYEKFTIPGGQQYQPCTYNIEGDWSGAAMLLVAGAIRGEITVTNLNPLSQQADRRILEALTLAGAKIEAGSNQVYAARDKIMAFEFDATHCPDLFPPLVALAACCAGVSKIKGAERLKHKESNRAIVLQQELAKLGVNIVIDGDFMLVSATKIEGGVVDSHQDHRIAMTAAVLGTVSSEPVKISGWQCVTKSYPEFFNDLAAVGGKVELCD